MNKEQLLTLWLDTEPSARSPYKLYGCPPMWETLEHDGMTLYTKPCRTMAQVKPFSYEEVDGVSYQWQKNGIWHGQAGQCTFEEFQNKVDGFKKESVQFDWGSRTNQTVLDLPFVEGLPSPEKAKVMTAWVKNNADLYANKLVKLYHATAASLPIEDQGLKPTSMTRRRSYQSTSGFVYLANTPERAETFGKMGNMGKCVVYEVAVLIRHLLPDKDQLSNKRSVGEDIGDSIGESIIYGGGVRVKGHIDAWQVRKLAGNEELNHDHASNDPSEIIPEYPEPDEQGSPETTWPAFRM